MLLLGFGNPARGDDALGPACIQEIERQAIPNVTTEADYQLSVEDAATIAQYDIVIFVDAALQGDEPFSFARISPQREFTLSTHAVSPEMVLGMAVDFFNAQTDAYILGIRGYSFEMFTEHLSEKATGNLHRAVAFLVSVLRSQNFPECTP